MRRQPLGLLASSVSKGLQGLLGLKWLLQLADTLYDNRGSTSGQPGHQQADPDGARTRLLSALPDETTRSVASLGELMRRNRRPREEEDGADSS